MFLLFNMKKLIKMVKFMEETSKMPTWGFVLNHFIEKTIHNLEGWILLDNEKQPISEEEIRYTLVGIFNEVPAIWYKGLRCQPEMLKQYLPM